jgi:hypothetical protein
MRQRRVRFAAIFGAALLAGGLAPAAAETQSAPRLALPVDCPMGSLCVVQNFVDMAPGEEARDQTCGPLTYDGHDGVDIRVPSLVEMRQGVAVVAAAPGVVKAIRDEMADVSVREIGAAALRAATPATAW